MTTRRVPPPPPFMPGDRACITILGGRRRNVIVVSVDCDAHGNWTRATMTDPTGFGTYVQPVGDITRGWLPEGR